jgi:hypothetical protein
MIRWVKGAKPGKASVKRKCEPEEVHERNLYLLFELVNCGTWLAPWASCWKSFWHKLGMECNLSAFEMTNTSHEILYIKSQQSASLFCLLALGSPTPPLFFFFFKSTVYTKRACYCHTRLTIIKFNRVLETRFGRYNLEKNESEKVKPNNGNMCLAAQASYSYTWRMVNPIKGHSDLS